MTQFLQFALSDFWTFLGTAALLSIVMDGLVKIAACVAAAVRR